jgi:phosphatidylserine decarboxylase
MSPVRIDPAGLPFIAGAAIVAVVTGAVAGWWFALPLVLFAVIFLYFFRDPERHSPPRPDAVLSPADGKVLVAGPAAPGIAPPGLWQQVSIFLSPLDVHVNRIPVSGKVTSVSYMPGRFLPAYRHDAATDNERSEIWIERGDGQHIVARQIVGMLARRVVCRVQPGAEVRAGDRFGVMKFGSRMDVFVPVTAELCVRAGDAVRGGETVIAVLH